MVESSAMILNIQDRWKVRRCIYCRPGKENIYLLSGRWDENNDISFEEIKEMVLEAKSPCRTYGQYKILEDNSSPKLGAPKCFLLVSEQVNDEVSSD